MNESLSVPTITSKDFSDVREARNIPIGISPLPKKKHPNQTIANQMIVGHTNDKLNLWSAATNNQCQDSKMINTKDTSVLHRSSGCGADNQPIDRNESSSLQQLKTSNPGKDERAGYPTLDDPETFIESGYLTPGYPKKYAGSSLPCSNRKSPLLLMGGNSRKGDTKDTTVARLGSVSEPGVGEGTSLQRLSRGKSNNSSPVYTTTSLCDFATLYEQHYEDIDHYNRLHDNQQYDHRDKRSQRNGTNILLVDKTPFGTNIPFIGVTSCHSDGCDHAPNTQELCSISASIHDPVPVYMQLNTDTPSGTSHEPAKIMRDNCRLICALVAVLLISLTALDLSVHDVVSSSRQTRTDHGQTLIKMQEKLIDLIKERQDLIVQQKNLASFVEVRKMTGQRESNQTQFLKEKITQASSKLRDLSYMLDLMNDKLVTEIANISLLPGPQGLRGMANFSLCLNKSLVRHAPASRISTTETSFLPSLDEIQNYFVTFAYCSYSGAMGSYLEAELNDTTARHRYRCKCWGLVPGVNHTTCKIVIWMCPQKS